MSRAFVTDKEDWIYCAKAGERCVHAERDKPCRKTDCDFFDRKVELPKSSSGAVRVVSRKPKQSDAKSAAKADTDSQQPRKTKKASIPKPKKWGGRSAFTMPDEWKKG